MKVEQDEPWCTCQRGKMDGFGRTESGLWVHSACGKQTKMVYEKDLVRKILEENGYQQSA